MDKNEEVIRFLMTCPIIQESDLFFNFAEEEDGNNHFITEADVATQKPYIDGSVPRQYTFTIASYKSVSHNPLVDVEGFANENMEEMQRVQGILDWINEQAENHNYPDFGSDCVIEEMASLTDDPDLDGVDTSVDPPMARYSIGVRIKYLDLSKIIWK